MSVENINELTLEEIEAELKWRRAVYPTLVGNLYPIVVQEDIVTLEERKAEIERILRNEGVDHES